MFLSIFLFILGAVQFSKASLASSKTVSDVVRDILPPKEASEFLQLVYNVLRSGGTEAGVEPAVSPTKGIFICRFIYFLDFVLPD